MNNQHTHEASEKALHPAEHLEGSFVETAFTREEVEAANAEEERLGMTTEQCAFLVELPSE